MAASSKRRGRKARGGHGAPPKPAASQRRDRRDLAAQQERVKQQLADRTLGTAGERPPGIFGPVPVSEFAIFAGIVVLVIGLINVSGRAQEVGVLLCTLGVLEVTAREHFSGYKSHTTLLAFLPAVVAELVWVVVAGIPDPPILLLVPVVPIFLLCSYLLRRRFRVARHGRIIGHR